MLRKHAHRVSCYRFARGLQSTTHLNACQTFEPDKLDKRGIPQNTLQRSRGIGGRFVSGSVIQQRSFYFTAFNKRTDSTEFRLQQIPCEPSLAKNWDTPTPPSQESHLQRALSKLDLYDNKAAYRTKSFTDLVRAYVILHACSVDTLVKHQFALLRFCRRLLGKRLFHALMRRTIYAQFMAGENNQQVLNNVVAASRNGVLPLLGFTAAELHGSTTVVGGKHQSADQFFQANIKGLKDSFRLAADCAVLLDPRVAGVRPRCTGKLTFLRPYQPLVTASSLITHNEEFVRKWLTGDGVSQILTQRLAALMHSFGQWSDACVLLMCMDFHYQLYHCMKTEKDYGIALDEASVIESEREMKILETVLSDLARSATELGVCLVWDAEQTYLQRAIDVQVFEQMRRFNRDRVVVYNTYQCYLKRTLDVVRRDTALAAKLRFCLGAKVVRGAYMDEERQLARTKGYEDPINSDYNATTDSYYNVAEHLLGELRIRPRGALHVIFGSHNDQTILHLLNRMAALGVEADQELLWLAQVYGLKDYIAFPLAAAGIPAAKLMQYGPIDNGVAYMSRRVQENRHGLNIASGKLECRLLQQEIKRRLKFRRH